MNPAICAGPPVKFKAILAVALLSASLAPGQEVGPWRMDDLKKSPSMRWDSQEGPVHSLFYSGEKYQDQPTEVFAYYASPVTLGQAKPGTKFPGVVLVHGGGGTAFAEWTWLWAKRGYAAIAMDLGGNRPPPPSFDPKTGVPTPFQASDSKAYTRLSNGGPLQNHPEKFDAIGGSVSDDWIYHAVASVVRAHSLLRSFPDVDADHTAITGISWGGFTTCLVASIDNRFKAAVPVYGCGFIHEGESVQKADVDKIGTNRQLWIDTYDPSTYLKRCHVPMLFVDGSNDVFYPLDSFQKSYDLVAGKKEIRIQVNMIHGHEAGWAPEEIGLFIDGYCRKGVPLADPGIPKIKGERVVVKYTSEIPLKEAALHFTTDSGRRSARTWQSLPAEIGKDSISSPKPPSGANTWFLSLTDERGAMVTTPVQFE